MNVHRIPRVEIDEKVLATRAHGGRHGTKENLRSATYLGSGAGDIGDLLANQYRPSTSGGPRVAVTFGHSTTLRIRMG
jgi:hypothetical protein